jgi:hypothetical protein
MGGNTFGYRQPESAGTYWRRRFIVLVVGFVVFGLAAWALSAALAVTTTGAGNAGSGNARAGAGRPGHARAGRHGQHHHPESRSSGRGRTNARTSAAVQPAASPPGSSASTSPAGQATGHGEILPAFCARSDIVLSLSTGETQFGPRQWPAFDINVVSTQQAECSFNIGSRRLALVIREGPARIWDSADCVTGTGGLDAALKRGVPTVLAVTWNRRTSAPGCSSPTAMVPPGTYTAYAVEGNLTSQPVTFRLT